MLLFLPICRTSSECFVLKREDVVIEHNKKADPRSGNWPIACKIIVIYIDYQMSENNQDSVPADVSK